MYLEVFLSLFVFMFCTYIVFYSLNMLCVEKQVSEFFVTHLATNSLVAKPQSRVHPEAFVTHLQLAKIFVTCSVVKRPETAF